MKLTIHKKVVFLMQYFHLSFIYRVKDVIHHYDSSLEK